MADNPLPFRKIIEEKVSELSKKELLKIAEREKQAVIDGLQRLKKDLGTVGIVLGAAYLTFRVTRYLFGGSRKKNKNYYAAPQAPTIIYRNNSDTKPTILDSVIRKFTEIALDIVEDKLKEKILNAGKGDDK